MVTLTGLLRTLTVSSQPLNCLPYQNSKPIGFVNGWKLNLTFPQFREIRDSYTALKNYNLKQIDQNLFEVDFGSFQITADILIVCALADMAYRHNVTQLGADLFRVEGDKFTLEGSSSMICFFRELTNGAYKADYKDKVVLDIGGFHGESAVHFWLSGAKKVIIYEPIAEYCEKIKKNIALNGVNAEIHNMGIGEKYGHLLVDVFTLNHNADKPKKEMIKIKNITDIINQSGADIAKLDCEKAEACITSVPDEVLRKIPCYMLELHSDEIERNLTAKFTQAGFKVIKYKKLGPDLSIAHFHL